MKKYIPTKLLMIAVLIFTCEMSMAAAAGGAEDDADLSHLPKKLQRPAKDFYDAVENYYRHAIVDDEAGGEIRARRPKGTSFYDHYCPPTGPGAVRPHRDRFLSEHIMAFVDWVIFSDGIGAEKDEPQATIAMRKIRYLTVTGDVPEDCREDPVQTALFLDRLERLGANPYAQHLRGVFIYCGVEGEPEQAAGHALILEAARGNYIGALRLLNAIHPFDDRIPEQKRLKWALEDLDDPKEFIEGFMEKRVSSITDIKSETFERFEGTVLNHCPGDNDRLWTIYRNLTPKLFDYFKSRQRPLGGLEKGLAQNVAISGTAAGVSIAWVLTEPGLEPVLSTVVSSMSLVASSYALVQNGSFYRGMSYLRYCCCDCSNCFREWAPMYLEDVVIDKEARLAALFTVIKFANKFQRRDFETAESAAHKIKLALGTHALSGTGSLAKMIFEEDDIFS